MEQKYLPLIHNINVHLEITTAISLQLLLWGTLVVSGCQQHEQPPQHQHYEAIHFSPAQLPKSYQELNRRRKSRRKSLALGVGS